MLGVTFTDWFVIILYLLGITAIGTWAMRKVKSSASFFISDRKFGKLMMMFFNFGTGTHSDQAVIVSAKTYKAGASGIWYQLLWIFSTPFYWLIAPMFRRMRAVTTSDFFEARFDTSTAVLYAVVAMMNLTVNIGLMLKGSSATIEAVSDGAIPGSYAVVAMTVMFLIYGVAGGLSAAIVTDFIQGILTIVLSFLILPFALYQVGGMTGMRATIDNPGMFNLVSVGGEIGLLYIVVISLNGLVGYGTQPHTMCLCAAGKTEMEARVGMTCGMFIKRFCTVAWVLTGLAALAYYMKQGATVEDVDHVYGLIARDLLPLIAPGLVGLFIASMLAGIMSSCDAFMVACSALFTENVYRKLIKPDASDRHYILVGRMASVLVVLCGIMFAFSLESVVEGLEIFWKISAIMGLAFWMGLFWRRTTPAGAWAGTLTSFAFLLFTGKIGPAENPYWTISTPFAEKMPSFLVWERTFFVPSWDFNAHFAHKLPDFMLWEGKLYLPWQMIIYLSAGLVALVVVSLLTRRVSKEQLDRFYACLRTPVEPNEPETEPFTLPPGVEPAPRKVWFDHFELEIPVISRVGLVGLIAASAAVVAFIAGVYWIFSLGT